jgi:hypothetical protein
MQSHLRCWGGNGRLHQMNHEMLTGCGLDQTPFSRQYPQSHESSSGLVLDTWGQVSDFLLKVPSSLQVMSLRRHAFDDCDLNVVGSFVKGTL